MASTAPPDESAVERVFTPPPGLLGALRIVTHKNVGERFIFTALFFFLVGGAEAMVMRAQLATPGAELLTAEGYNDLFTMHGTTMMFFFAVPFVEGLANYLLPLMVGARDLPFPRLNAFNYWVYLAGGITLYLSFATGDAPDAGWFAYVPLTGPIYSPDSGLDFWLVGITLAEISAIGAAIEFIAATMKLRAPGMSLFRMPPFVWTALVMAIMIVLAFTPLLVGSILLELDRAYGTAFFQPDLGGSAVMWQHFFWIFGHPEVYVMFLPATGIVSQVVQSFTGRGLVAYPLVIASIIGVGFLSLGLWVHHMFTVGLPLLALSFFSAASIMIAVPSGIQVFAWIATMWKGKPRLEVPMLFVVGFVITFVLGGITGVMVAIAPFDWQAHDSYFLVAHFHYVLIGGVVFPALAGLYYWLPKLTGRLINARAGLVSFALVFVGFNVAFFPMHITGLEGMPRRIYTYPEGAGWGGLNLLSSIGAWVLGAGFLVTAIAVVVSRFRGKPAGSDPWKGDTLEWRATSPPAQSNFERLPVVSGRHPLWEKGRPAAAVPAIDALEQGPVAWRATLGTTPVSARPAEIVHLPGPTAIPLLPVAGLVIASSGLLVSETWLLALGAVVVIAGLAVWAWRNETERRDALGDVREFGGLELNVAGAAGVGWWGWMLFGVVWTVVLMSLLFAHLYLRFHNDAWPPLVDVGQRGLLLAGIAVLVALAGAAGARLAARAAEGGPWRAVRPRLAATAGLLAVALALVIAEIAGLPFGITEDAYASSFYVCTTFAAVTLAFAAVVVAAIALLGSRLTDARRRVVAGHGVLVAYGAAGTLLAVYVALYLAERL